MMIKPSIGLVLLTALLFAGGQPAVAQQSGPGPQIATLTEEIEKLNESLDDIARSLRVLLTDQKIQVLIRRIELEERRQAPLGSELRSARSDVRAQEEELARMEAVMEDLREQLDEAVRTGADPQSAPQRTELQEIERYLEMEQDRLEKAEARAIDLDNDAARGRDRIQILDEKLQELIDASE